MSNDDTLRDVLRGDAGNGGMPDDAWGNVRARAKTIQQRRRVVRGGIAGLAAVALVGAVLFAAGTFRDDEHTIATNPPTEQIVAVQGPNNGGDNLVVLDAADGHVIRTLADDIGITFGGISATPDGQTIYFARRLVAVPCDRIEIAKVSSAGGPVELIGQGISPVVSPDGRTLAYVRAPADDPCGRTTELVRRDLASGDETAELMSEACDGCGVLSPISWSPDSTRLLVAGCCVNEWWNSLLVRPVDAPGETRFLSLESPVDGATYLPDGRILVAFEQQEPPNGAQLHKLEVFEGDLAPAQNNPPTAADFQLQPIETVLESHQPGVLRITANSASDVLLHFGGSELQRWHPGGAEPVTIAHDIRDAAWLPAARTEPPPEPTTTTTPIPPVLGPAQMLVATADHQLEVLGSSGYLVMRRLGESGHDIPWIAVTPDGKTAYYEQGTLDPCDAAGEIDAVRLDIYPPGFSGGYMGSHAALSPDGTKLAYRSGACGGGLVVRDLSTGDRLVFAEGNERSWTLADPGDGGPRPELVGPVGWDADNQHLMVRVNREPTTEFWYVDTATDAGEISGPAFGPRGEQGAETGPHSFAPLGTTGRWAAVDEEVGGPSLVEYDLAGDSVVRPLAELPTSSVAIVGSDPTGQHVLLLVPTNGGYDLWRWSAGDAVTTLVAHDITAADW